ncbi:MAG TPA: hypothetical protein VJY15_11635 [Candidatus Acidoferrum sp.]|nr:hypothetical protein [Candidatus Acidoferrum sp.]
MLELDHDERHGVWNYASIGVLLAAGFYTKAILFYFGLFVLSALILRGLLRRQYRKPFLATLGL